MKYDATLKELCADTPVLLQLLSGQAHIARVVSLEFSSVKQRRPDLLIEFTDADPLQIELQSDNDASMGYRLLEYYAIIAQQLEGPIRQTVLYVGDPPLNMTAQIEHPQLHFRYTVIDIRTLSCEQLLESEALGDNLLALLGKLENRQLAVRRVLRSIMRLDSTARTNALEKLAILSGLRPKQLPSLIHEEAETMSITIDLEQNPLFRAAFQRYRTEGIEEGIEQGAQTTLLRQLRARFGDDLPDWVQVRVQQSSLSELESYSINILTAETLEAVFIV